MDDIVLVARSRGYLIEAFKATKRKARSVGPVINQEKTKYMPVIRTHSNQTHLLIEDYKFELVAEFIYLGLLFNRNSNILPEVRKHLARANKTFFFFWIKTTT